MERATNTHQRETVPAIYLRCALGSLLFAAVFMPSVFQPLLTRRYSFLYQSSFYRFSGFETFETVLCYIIDEPFCTYTFGRNPQMRIDMRGAGLQMSDKAKPKVPKMRRPPKGMGELVTYAAPLLSPSRSHRDSSVRRRM